MGALSDCGPHGEDRAVLLPGPYDDSPLSLGVSAWWFLCWKAVPLQEALLGVEGVFHGL